MRQKESAEAERQRERVRGEVEKRGSVREAKCPPTQRVRKQLQRHREREKDALRKR